MAAHEAHIATLKARIDDMRGHLDQAGVRLHAADTHLRGGMNAGEYVKVHTRNGDDARQLQRYGSFKMSNLLSAGADEHAGDTLAWITQQQVPEDKLDAMAVQR